MHNATRSFCQSHDLVSRSSITVVCVILICSVIFTFRFCWRLWLIYASCQMMSMRKESGVMELHFNCHYEFTIWILNQVYFFIRCWAYCRHSSSLYILFWYVSSLLPSAPMYPWEQLPAWVNNWQLTMAETDWVLIIIVRNIRPSLSFVDQWELWFSLDCVPLYWNKVPQVRSTSFVDSYWVWWQCLAVLR